MNLRQLFLENVAQTTPFPMALEIERAEGCKMYSSDGKAYLDMISGISVSNIGHCHPRVVEAIKNQSKKFMHLMVYGEYIYEPQVMLAQKLKSLLPEKFDNFYFLNSGSEAVEAALKLAKRYTGKPHVISCKNAYHGSSAGAMSAMGSEEYKEKYRPLVTGHSLIEYNVIEDLDKINRDTAAVLIEVVQAESGIYEGDKHYFQLLREKCNQTGTLLMFDEIQTGIGRTGTFFAFEDIGVEPDVLLLGKAIGGGMPLSAMIANKEIMSSLSHNPILGHISTFGGNPVCCAAALACIEVMVEENLVSQVHKKGDYLEKKLNGIGITDIRRKGLMSAIEFGTQERNFEVIGKCVENGIIVDWFLFNTHSMRVCPPLTITEEEIDTFVSVLEKCL